MFYVSLKLWHHFLAKYLCKAKIIGFVGTEGSQLFGELMLTLVSL
jgi:hypothetical protein